MRKVIQLAVGTAAIIVAIFLFWYHGVRAAGDAVSSQSASTPDYVPAGTAIWAVINSGIASSALPGETVIAIVSSPVALEGTVVIPAGAQLNGSLENLAVSGDKGTADLNFTVLSMHDQSFAIQTGRVVANTPVQGDIQLLSTAFRTMMGATLGAAIGAASGDMKLVSRGLCEGIGTPASETTDPFRVILTGDLKL